jgi:hypothetical protein
MTRALCIPVLFALLLAGCNQPFEPNGPVSSTLAVYCLLSPGSDTQYVRLSTTFGATPAPEIRDANVTLTVGGTVIPFTNTTVLWRDAAGNFTPTNVYVASSASVGGGLVYRLNASTPSGLAASATITSLRQPSLALRQGTTPGFFALTRQFKTLSGAAILHFYLDYYVLVNNGWVLRTEEIPSGRSTDASGNDVLQYPSISPVTTLAAGGSDVAIDSTLFQIARSRVLARAAPAPVVYLDVRFVLTQIDDILYAYYYLSNGPLDNSTIRLDVPDYKNIQGGYGVFGSRAEVILLLPLAR